MRNRDRRSEWQRQIILPENPAQPFINLHAQLKSTTYQQIWVADCTWAHGSLNYFELTCMGQKATSTVKINKCIKTANISVKNFQFKTVCNGRHGLRDKTKTAKIKKCYY